MGFSLKSFFEDLESVINNDDEDLIAKYLELEQMIMEAKSYAEDCGQLK